MTIKDRYPFPGIDAIFDCLFGAKFFSTLDLFGGFWQNMVKDDDRIKTAFTCEAGHYEFSRMSFGLCNAPVSFQRLV